MFASSFRQQFIGRLGPEVKGRPVAVNSGCKELEPEHDDGFFDEEPPEVGISDLKSKFYRGLQ